MGVNQPWSLVCFIVGVCVSVRWRGCLSQATGLIVHAPSAAVPALVSALSPALQPEARALLTQAAEAATQLALRAYRAAAAGAAGAGSVANDAPASTAAGASWSDAECRSILSDGMEKLRTLALAPVAAE